jgi:hypothetical protein
MNERKFFIAEIGVDSPSRSFGSNFMFMSASTPETVLIIAEDYNDAAKKAELYLENMPPLEPENILDGDGSLKNLEQRGTPQILSIKASSAKIIW